MVAGLNKVKEFFSAYPDHFIIIGGTACDVIIERAGLKPRATKDIDIILVVEVLNSYFVRQFWKFVEDGIYERREKGAIDRKYYRFINPENKDFPVQIELFSRNPDLMDIKEGTHLTPIPVDDDLTSLSAILLDDDYYKYVIEHSDNIDGLLLARKEALICLKAKAYLDIVERIDKGGKEDKKKLLKHKGDVFRLGVMLAQSDLFSLPEKMKAEIQVFVDRISENLPGNEIFKEMGLNAITARKVLNQIIKSFQLNGE